MVKRNSTFAKVSPSYLYIEIKRRKDAYLASHPGAKLVNLSIGDTSEPIPDSIALAMQKSCADLSQRESYRGYGPEQGESALRGRISEKIYSGRIKPDEIFISDGAKCDLGRLQMLFGNDNAVALIEPGYPVYRDAALLMGQRELISFPASPENNFFPNLEGKRFDLLFFCSPSNPTGKAANRSELETLIKVARKNRAIIVYDAAYAAFVQGDQAARSIYEIEGANEVAIEVSSFSKSAGFSGVRLGWTVIPHALAYEGEAPGGLNRDWNRITTTLFNGASLISQAGGLEALSEEGFKKNQDVVLHYLENARLLKEALVKRGYEVYGGEHIPYLWTREPSCDAGHWESFDHFLNKKGIVVAPGAGFGASGAPFVRLSALASRNAILEAIERL